MSMSKRFSLLLVGAALASCGGNYTSQPECGTFLACGGTLAGTAWVLNEGCGDMQSVPTNLTFNTNGTYTTENGTGNYTVQSDTFTLTFPGVSPSPAPVTSAYCISDGLLALSPLGDPAQDYVIYQKK